MDTPLDEMIAILLRVSNGRETTEERFEAIWGQLKLLGWKAKKSARFNWVRPLHISIFPVDRACLIWHLTLGIKTTRQY